MRILVTGSRDWPWEQRFKVFTYLNRAALNSDSVELDHGGCPFGSDVPSVGIDVPYKGVDGLSDLHGRLLGWDVQVFSPDRSKGRQGFAIRNQRMVDRLPDKVLAFYLRGAENKGTKMTAQMAKRKGLWVLELWSD